MFCKNIKIINTKKLLKKTLKHNAMKCKIQNTGKTPVKKINREKFLQIIQYIVHYFYWFLLV